MKFSVLQVCLLSSSVLGFIYTTINPCEGIPNCIITGTNTYYDYSSPTDTGYGGYGGYGDSDDGYGDGDDDGFGDSSSGSGSSGSLGSSGSSGSSGSDSSDSSSASSSSSSSSISDSDSDSDSSDSDPSSGSLGSVSSSDSGGDMFSSIMKTLTTKEPTSKKVSHHMKTGSPTSISLKSISINTDIMSAAKSAPASVRKKISSIIENAPTKLPTNSAERSKAINSMKAAMSKAQNGGGEDSGAAGPRDQVMVPMGMGVGAFAAGVAAVLL